MTKSLAQLRWFRRRKRSLAHDLLTEHGVPRHKDGNRLGLRSRMTMSPTALRDAARKRTPRAK